MDGNTSRKQKKSRPVLTAKNTCVLVYVLAPNNERAAPMWNRPFVYSAINMSQIARHFRTADNQKRSICPKSRAALAQAKLPLTARRAKGFPADAETPRVPNRSPPQCILPRISHFPQNRGSDWQYRGIPSPLNIGEGRPQKEVARSRTAPAIS